ncbi:MAG: outer membrane lipoprotein chaperone LolA [Pseudomonadota bacterium]
MDPRAAMRTGAIAGVLLWAWLVVLAAPVAVAAASAPAVAAGSAGSAATAAPAAGARPSAADAVALARVEQAIASLDSVRAEFVQELVDPRTKSTQRATGTLSIRKPGKFRWDYAAPAQVIVSDGERLWLYDADLEQVTVRRVRDTLSQTPAMLLSGRGRIADGFTAQALPRADGLEWVRLVPKRGDTDFRELRLGFADGTLRRMEFEDKLNQLTRITLTKIERNARLDDRLFTFVPPPGADVIGPAR